MRTDQALSVITLFLYFQSLSLQPPLSPMNSLHFTNGTFYVDFAVLILAGEPEVEIF